ncbi:MAG: hypothetical protein OXL41_08195, partial [Nitrospinae bacterium]|nr:hypothetical protein [Nitrospinota bacterium]
PLATFCAGRLFLLASSGKVDVMKFLHVRFQEQVLIANCDVKYASDVFLDQSRARENPKTHCWKHIHSRTEIYLRTLLFLTRRIFFLKFQAVANQMVFEVQGDEYISGIEFISV